MTELLDMRPDRAELARRALGRARVGSWLLAGYLVVSVVVMTAVGMLAPARFAAVAWLTAGAGCLLLAGVGIANSRARRPLRAHWPELVAVAASGSFQPGSAGAGCLYLMTLSVAGALALLVAVAYGVAHTSATTQVSVVSCNNPGRGQIQVCAAHWQAQGRTYYGTITWESPDAVGTVVPGRYDPAHPGTVYSASLPYLDAASVGAIVWLVVLGPLAGYLYRRYRRDCRGPYLAALSQAAAASGDGADGLPPAVAAAAPGAVPPADTAPSETLESLRAAMRDYRWLEQVRAGGEIDYGTDVAGWLARQLPHSDPAQLGWGLVVIAAQLYPTADTDMAKDDSKPGFLTGFRRAALLADLVGEALIGLAAGPGPPGQGQAPGPAGAAFEVGPELAAIDLSELFREVLAPTFPVPAGSSLDAIRVQIHEQMAPALDELRQMIAEELPEADVTAIGWAAVGTAAMFLDQLHELTPPRRLSRGRHLEINYRGGASTGAAFLILTGDYLIARG